MNILIILFTSIVIGMVVFMTMLLFGKKGLLYFSMAQAISIIIMLMYSNENTFNKHCKIF
nr:MAG: hypothetical protein DiTV3a_F1ORF7 [Diabrotica toursvirus 3a]